MSRIGKKPIPVPDAVQVDIKDRLVKVKGPKGELSETVSERVKVSHDTESKTIVVERMGDLKSDRAHHGLWRSLINNMVVGVSEGFKKELEIVGTGYRAKASGNKITITIGFSHDVVMTMPKGIEISTPTPQKIDISGADKREVGQVAANIRKIRPPEPYKGKGIRYKGEYVRRLVGKTFGSTGA
ncbi:MAG: 50S ribosomal protein L6 [Planctomycetota bacterium]|nr:50S ribosomal protein L6 [Planctomycetota bacterium]